MIEPQFRSVYPGLRAVFLVIFAALIHIWLNSIGIGPRIDSTILEWWFSLRGRIASPSEISVVKIDGQAYRAVHRIVGDAFPREALAQALVNLGELGAKVVVVDGVMEKKKDASGDKALIEALSVSPTLIGRSYEIISETLPDGSKKFVRNDFVPRKEFEEEAAAVWSLALFDLNGRIENISFEHRSKISSTEPKIPLYRPLKKFASSKLKHPGSRDKINFYGPPYSIPNISIAKLLDENYAEAEPWIKDKVVFVGYMLEHTVDLKAPSDRLFTYYTPVSPTPMFGVEIHATTAANLLQGTWIKRLPLAAELIIMSILAGIILHWSSLCRFSQSAVIILSSMTWWLTCSYFAFSQLSFFIPGGILCFIIWPLFLYSRLLVQGYLFFQRFRPEQFGGRVNLPPAP